MMKEPLRVFGNDTIEYAKLICFCFRFNEATNANAKVKTIYFDYGQNWKFTTVVADYQVLTPRLQEMVLYGSLKDVQEALIEAVEIYNRIKGDRK